MYKDLHIERRVMNVTKRFSFDSAHYLPLHRGKCKNLHGHTYILEVTIKGEINSEGMVIDFGILSALVKETIIEKFDHKNLNDEIINPTAENMAVIFYQIIKNKFPEFEVAIKLFETPDSWVQYGS